MTAVTAVASAFLAAAAAAGSTPPGRARRLACVRQVSPAGPQPVSRRQSGRPARHGSPPAVLRSSGPRSASALAGGALALLVGGPSGWLLGCAVAALLPYVLGRLEPAQTRRDRLRIAADLPVAVELVSACLASGAPPAASLAVVAGAVGGPLGLRLGRVAGALQLGADPASAWAPFAATTELGPLARAMIRAYDSGAPLAATLDRTALDLRAQQRASAAEAAQAVAVKAVGPLGACFLPAFVLLGVVPTVWGIAITTFGGWA